jgi:hypothetical protein
MQSKMLAYDQAVTELNKARLRGTSFPIIHALFKISQEISTDVRHLFRYVSLKADFIEYSATLNYHSSSIRSPKLLLNRLPSLS